MNPTQSQFQQLQAEVVELRRIIDSFYNAAQFDPLIKRSFTQSLTGSSTKTAASGTQAINEAGAGAYNVMKAPTGFISIGGKNIPYIT